ncbi:CoA-transferase family III domain-containing protein [Aspergillus pseudoustus]|uniref:CoA-transferase family III domain-containing protein n=1 Tax=Aspergillus pseudoustus TaxID=1810923 RepID=A0ABR4KSZ3_9EURO
MADEFCILTPNAMLGYGYRVEHFWYGIEKFAPKAIIVDSGSTDGGPYKLGLNKMTCGRESYVRDLTPILQACFHKKIQVLIASVGGDGSDKHVQEMFEIVQEIAAKEGLSFKVATIRAGFSKRRLTERIANKRVGPCGPVEELTVDSAERAIDIVAQMGAEPYLKALESNPDIILGGRSYDPAPFAAFSIYHGVEPGVAWHMGKIMECGGICAVPKGRSMVATMRKDSFNLTPLAPKERCTPLSVAAHTLYEKTRPDRLPGPGGVLVLDNASYEQLTEKTVRVRGANFIPSPVYQVKLEGVEKLGYRTIFIGGVRDPILISHIDEFLAEVRAYTQNLFPELDQSPQCRLIFHFYGRNGTMGPIEPSPVAGHELGILGEVVAPSQELSYTIANNARASILHMPYTDQVATTGNFASPLSPHETPAGPVFRFNVYHLVDLEEGEEVSLFPIRLTTIDNPPRGTVCPGLTDAEREQLATEPLQPLSSKAVPQADCKLLEIAKIIRSKNSGPFELTFDVMFDNEEAYRRVKDANILTNERMMELYHLKREDIITNMFFEPALSWKCTIRRPWEQGTVGERDTLGTQQHGPLLNIMVPEASKNYVQSRSNFTAKDSVGYLWTILGLPAASLSQLHLPGEGAGLPSSFKIAHLAQASIGLSALLAAQIHAHRNSMPIPPIVTVPLQHAVIEFKSERLYTFADKPTPSPWGPIGGLHKTADGYVRLHDSFPNHRDGAKTLLGCSPNADREEVSAKIASWRAIDLEQTAFTDKLVISALRSYSEWDVLPQARAIADFPILLRKLTDGPKGLPTAMQFPNAGKALRGLRILELSRVIAAPLAGKTLAAHGADVLWVTSPNLPDLPTMDRDFGRGKRTIQLDLNDQADKNDLARLLDDAHVFIQGFRPGSLAARNSLCLSPADLATRYKARNIICANMSAYGPSGPWASNRGFDSLIQTCSGMNVSEAEHFGAGEPARPTPCQALDHAGGYFLAAGILAALYKQATEGGSWEVDVSLAGVMKYLRSLGQWEGKTGFAAKDYTCTADVPGEFLETRDTGFGVMTSVRHSASIEGVRVGWDVMPKPLGSDEKMWL